MTSHAIEVGDWVRFYQNGKIVVGVVNYIRPRHSWERCDRLLTDVGEVSRESVLEHRKPTGSRDPEAEAAEAQLAALTGADQG